MPSSRISEFYSFIIQLLCLQWLHFLDRIGRFTSWIFCAQVHISDSDSLADIRPENWEGGSSWRAERKQTVPSPRDDTEGRRSRGWETWYLRQATFPILAPDDGGKWDGGRWVTRGLWASCHLCCLWWLKEVAGSAPVAARLAVWPLPLLPPCGEPRLSLSPSLTHCAQILC